ncbi:MAG TPA: PilZ domain-containing protein [Thermoanaerobaculia bacterium]
MSQERREYQRLTLTKPLDGTFGDQAVRVVDVSATGALIESDVDIPVGSRALLRFSWRGNAVELNSEIVRIEHSRAGVHFSGDSERLRKLIAESAEEVLRAQMANLEGERERNVIAGEETLTTASAGLRAAGFVTWSFKDGKWRSRRSLLPDQPPDGFTVAGHESEEQVELLRSTYESGDEESRRITRLLAELSVATVR